MRPIKASVVRCLPVGAVVDVADNSGAKKIKIIAVKGYHGVRRRLPAAGIADLVWGSVIEGKPEMKHKVVMAVIIRTRKEYRRADGTRIKFEDNACVLVKNEEGEPVGSIIKGPVAREAVQRFLPLGKIAKVVV